MNAQLFEFVPPVVIFLTLEMASKKHASPFSTSQNWSQVLVLVSGTIVGNWLIFYVKSLENHTLCDLCWFTQFWAVHFLWKPTQNRRKTCSFKCSL